MSEPGVYDQVYPSLDSQLLGEATEIDSNLEDQSQDVATLLKQFAGVNPGPIKRVTKITNYVPTLGMEYPFEKKQINKEVVELGLQFGGSGKKVLSKGFLFNVSVTAGVGKNVTVSFEHHGEAVAFE